MIAVEKEVINRFKVRVWDKYEKSYWLQSTIEQNIHWLMNPEEYKDANYPPDYVKIEQCTGLKDKNGKLIYEGDLIKEPANKYLLEIYYDKGAWLTREYRKNGNNEQFLYVLINCYGVEVIGNINENADLLGETK